MSGALIAWLVAGASTVLALGTSLVAWRRRSASPAQVAEGADDPLTGLAGHRRFHERLAEEVQRARRNGRELALVVLDLDGFRGLNETYGHEAGDALLSEVGRRIGALARAGDLVARTGGDQFAWILPETGGLRAYSAAERARATISEAAARYAGQITVSAGTCDLSQASDAPGLLRLAEGALYWAKANGRDITCRYSPEVVTELSPSERAARLERVNGLSALRALARAVDAKDSSTRRHSDRVSQLAEKVALACGWTRQRAEALSEAALLHDVGKIGVPDAVLFKDGPLTPAEYEQVKQHSVLGARIASELLGPEEVSWIRGHHERYDGGGYPDGLIGEEIPEGAQILALADAWDTMTAGRSYRPAMTADDALREIERESGRQFAPASVSALVGLARTGELPATPVAVPEPEDVEAPAVVVKRRVPDEAPAPPEPPERVPPRAMLFVIGSMVAAVLAYAMAIFDERVLGDPIALLLLTAGAASSQMVTALAPGSLSYHLSLAFVFAGVLLLPPAGVLVMVVAMHLPAWLKEKFPWYMQGFNIANVSLSSLAAHTVIIPMLDAYDGLGAMWVLTVCLGAAAFVLVNHSLLAVVLRLARGVTVRESNLFKPSHVAIDLLLLTMGAGIALAWDEGPVTAILPALPLLLVYRALHVPALEQETRTDAKTGLLNARVFAQEAAEVCRRASADGTPMTLAMVDLDYLREINNTHGHLAGDAVIIGIARVLEESSRETDIVVRFGGEEFAILMPDTTLDEAEQIVEAARAAVEERVFESAGVKMRATVSAGLTGGPGTIDEMISRADAALYRAKAAGRNRLVVDRARSAVMEPLVEPLPSAAPTSVRD